MERIRALKKQEVEVFYSPITQNGHSIFAGAMRLLISVTQFKQYTVQYKHYCIYRMYRINSTEPARGISIWEACGSNLGVILRCDCFMFIIYFTVLFCT